jgi:hypothetical protein
MKGAPADRSFSVPRRALRADAPVREQADDLQSCSGGRSACRLFVANDRLRGVATWRLMAPVDHFPRG